jgi:hypothetical protein
MNRKEKTDYKQREQQGERKGNIQDDSKENKRLMQSKRSNKEQAEQQSGATDSYQKDSKEKQLYII